MVALGCDRPGGAGSRRSLGGPARSPVFS